MIALQNCTIREKIRAKWTSDRHSESSLHHACVENFRESGGDPLGPTAEVAPPESAGQIESTLVYLSSK